MLIVAHAGYPALLDSGADFIEIDVRRHQGVIIDAHDAPKAGTNHATLDEILEAVSRRELGLHLDVKESGYEIDLISRALERLPAGRIVATPDFEESIRVIKQKFPAVRVSPIDFMALEQKDATPERLDQCEVPVWVWTVDRVRSMRRFIDDPKVEALITNRPDRAIALRHRKS
ncbi:MAG TPA: glycerophosphodiester phosphodiesterase [Candidatus Dormibacteraeota bacterium]|nr:glycerophosphodiester phosphodiesterase [Candidatus Dormibacteraeota bacterium]